MTSIQENRMYNNEIHPMDGCALHYLSNQLPPLNSLRLMRMNGQYIDPYQQEEDVVERSLSPQSFVWPTGTITFHPFITSK